MHILRLNTILFMIGSLFWYLAAGLVLYAVWAPVKVESVNDPVRRPAVSRESENNIELPPIAAYAAVWHNPLQRPVFDAPSLLPAPEVKPELPKIKAQLLATMKETAGPTAMLKIPPGKTVVLKAGDRFENEPGSVQIIEIHDKQIVLKLEGFEEIITLGMK
jgi:hypothetical protein